MTFSQLVKLENENIILMVNEYKLWKSLRPIKLSSQRK